MPYPDWFLAYTAKPRQDHFIIVDDARIHYQTWNQKTRQALLFVHGHAAHSHWWDFIAPTFCGNYHVAAMDMSGNGDSDHRPQYSALTYANEILSVARCLGSDTIIVGHSFGGAMTRVTAFLFREKIAGFILVDSVIPTSKSSRKPPVMPRLKSHNYATLVDGMKRFRLRPPQPCENQFIIDYIAGHSLRETETGFQFKVDQAVFSKMVSVDLPDAASMIRSTDVPGGFIYGNRSRFFSAESVALVESLFEKNLVRKVTDAHHHVFLDQPLAFIRTLTDLLATMGSGKNGLT